MKKAGTALEWSVDTPYLIREMVEGNPFGGILAQPVNILTGILAQVAKRAIELDDPELNVLMLRLNLYEVPPTDRLAAIEAQTARLAETSSLADAGDPE